MSSKIVASINLSKLIHKKIKTKEGVECIVIPIKENFLEENQYGIQIPVKLNYKPEGDQYNGNGFISKQLSSDQYKAMSEAEREAAKEVNPILGNIKEFGGGGSYQAAPASNTVAAEDLSNDLGDDLVF